ncbi:MAG: Bax inhibitor-1 family protein [Parachlamydiales bacterium]
MSIWDRNYVQEKIAGANASAFTNRVYGWMTVGLLVTAAVTFGLIHTGLFAALLPYWWLPVFGTLGVAIGIRSRLDRLSVKGLTGLFLLYAVLEGLFFGMILPLYASAYGGQIIWVAFLTAGLLFGSSVLYGLFTRTDLSRFGGILRMGLMGLVGITLVYFLISLFAPLPGMILLISYVGLVLFVGLTAYQAQAIRALSLQADNSAAAYKLSLMMALSMYLNVIMIFWYLLQIFASSRRR